MDSSLLPILAIFLLVGCSAFFSGSEIAYSSVGKLRVRKAAESGKRRDRIVLYIYENFEKALSAILIGNNLVNNAAASLATVWAISLLGASGAGYATVVMTVVILIFGEIAPKIVAKEHADSVARGVAYPLRLCMWLLTPVVWIASGFIGLISKLWSARLAHLPSVTEEELVTIIETVEDEGVIDEDQSELIQSAIEFSEITAQEIATPRVRMLAIDVEDEIDEILRVADRSPYSRIPVYEGSIDNIIGVLSLNHFYKRIVDDRDFSFRSLLLEPCFIPKSMKLPTVLSELRQLQSHLAVVTDEYGGTFGILTLEDALEELVGDIWDETDEVKNEFVEIGDNLFEVDGNLGIYDFLELVEIDERKFDGDFTTVGGWAIEMLDGYPDEGDSFVFENLTVTVHKVDARRIKSLIVEIAQDSL